MPQYFLAAIGGVKPNAQVKYENGRRIPRGDYLAAIVITGMDLLYILTGKRSVGMSQLTSEERLFIAAYRFIQGPDKHLMSHFLTRLDGLLNHGPQARRVGLYDGADILRISNG